MRSKKVFAMVIFGMAAVVVVFGIVQLYMYLSPILSMLNEARMQGATEQQISEYFSLQVMPKVMTDCATTFGIALVLAASGLISLQLSDNSLLLTQGQAKSVTAGASQVRRDTFSPDEARGEDFHRGFSQNPVVESNEEFSEDHDAEADEEDFFAAFEAAENAETTDNEKKGA